MFVSSVPRETAEWEPDDSSSATAGMAYNNSMALPPPIANSDGSSLEERISQTFDVMLIVQAIGRLRLLCSMWVRPTHPTTYGLGLQKPFATGWSPRPRVLLRGRLIYSKILNVAAQSQQWPRTWVSEVNVRDFRNRSCLPPTTVKGANIITYILTHNCQRLNAIV